MELLILIVFGFALIWLFVMLPNRRRQSSHAAMINRLEPGDEVITAGGLYGTVSRVLDDHIELEVAEGVDVKVAKRAIAAVVPPEDEGDDYDEDDDAEDPETAPARDSVEQPRS